MELFTQIAVLLTGGIFFTALTSLIIAFFALVWPKTIGRLDKFEAGLLETQSRLSKLETGQVKLETGQVKLEEKLDRLLSFQEKRQAT